MELYETFHSHRRKARVLYLKDPVTAERLAITGSMPRSYLISLETVKNSIR